jgi:hypothetical protein
MNFDSDSNKKVNKLENSVFQQYLKFDFSGNPNKEYFIDNK